MKKIIISTVVFLLSISTFALGENRSPNEALLEEIDIMEAVLSGLIGKNTNGVALWDSNVKGFYLNGYGVILNAAYPAQYNFSMVVLGPEDITAPEAEDAKVAHAAVELQKTQRVLAIKDKDKIEKKDVIPEIKKALITFFTKYASSISELKNDEKITAIFDLNGFSFMTSHIKGDPPQQIMATLSMDDIADFKRKKITDEELGKRIIFDEIESVDRDVSIFSNVIQTSLAHMKQDSAFGFQGNVKSIYLKGHGIVFMLDANVGIKSFKLLNDNLKEMEKNLKDMEKKLEVTGTTINKKIVTKPIIANGPKADDFKEYEEKLVKIISKYGNTLSNIKSDEYVEVALRLNKLGIREGFSKGHIKVKKADIDNFHKGKINFDNFKKKVSVIYY